MDTGRKFWITLIGMALCAVRPDAASAVAALGLAFCGANAAVSWAYSKSDSTARSLTGTTDIEALQPNVYADDERG